MKTKIEKIYDKYNKGDALTNEEIVDAYLHFKKLSEILMQSGVEWRIAEREAARAWLGFRNLMWARNITVTVNGVQQ